MPTTVTFYSDYLCPWCWPAAVALRKLRKELPDLTVVHRAYLLVPREGSRPVFTDYQLSHRRAAAARTGLPYSLPAKGAPYPLSSWPSQMTAAWIRQYHPHLFDTFDEAVFQAFFQHNRDIADTRVLTEVSGLPELGLASKEVIAEEHEEAIRAGISGIPSVIIDDQLFSGAFEYEVYRAALLR